MADTTPDPRNMTRMPARQTFPKQPADPAAADSSAPDISQRPGLPDQPQIMAADIEDEDADPVVDSGPGIADGELNRK